MIGIASPFCHERSSDGLPVPWPVHAGRSGGFSSTLACVQEREILRGAAGSDASPPSSAGAIALVSPPLATLGSAPGLCRRLEALVLGCAGDLLEHQVQIALVNLDGVAVAELAF